MSGIGTRASNIRAGRMAGGWALAVLCMVQVAPASPARAEPSAPDHHLQGVWEPLGGALLDPNARALPGNKGRPMTELNSFPPYNAEFQKRYDKTTADLRAGVHMVDLSAMCLPQGMPRMMAIGYPIDIIVQPTRVVMMFEPGMQRRIIHTDGRQHTKPDDIDPSFSGESIGHWEGDTLVVDTVGIRGDLMFDYTFTPHSDALHIIERIRRVNDTLEDDMTLEDVKAFTRPWHITRTYKLQPTWELKEYVCVKE